MTTAAIVDQESDFAKNRAKNRKEWEVIMESYTIIRKPPVLNWAEVPALAIDRLYWSEPVDIGAEARLCYDDQALYVWMRTREQHIRSEHTAPTGSPCEDSCLEFFFCPNPDDERYFNIEFNPNACMYLGLARNRHELVRLLPEKPPFMPETERTADGWSLTYRIPFTFIRHFFPEFVARPGGSIHANCYKCGDLTPVPHFLSWNPLTSETPDFHRPEDFGLMRFE